MESNGRFGAFRPEWHSLPVVNGGLLAWYDRAKRSLPWRGSRDPYTILVSEIMLQQTQVAVVREPFARFMERFPTVEALAAAPPEAVLAAWSGLISPTARCSATRWSLPAPRAGAAASCWHRTWC